LGNFLLETGYEDIIDVEVLDVVHKFELLGYSLTEVFGIRVALDSDNFDLVVFVLFFLELLQEFVLEIVDLDFF
jgi:hypothetical protein